MTTDMVNLYTTCQKCREQTIVNTCTVYTTLLFQNKIMAGSTYNLGTYTTEIIDLFEYRLCISCWSVQNNMLYNTLLEPQAQYMNPHPSHPYRYAWMR